MSEICNEIGSDNLGGTGNIVSKYSGIWSIFQVLALFFHLSPQKTELSHLKEN